MTTWTTVGVCVVFFFFPMTSTQSVAWLRITFTRVWCWSVLRVSHSGTYWIMFEKAVILQRMSSGMRFANSAVAAFYRAWEWLILFTTENETSNQVQMLFLTEAQSCWNSPQNIGFDHNMHSAESRENKSTKSASDRLRQLFANVQAQACRWTVNLLSRM